MRSWDLSQGSVKRVSLFLLVFLISSCTHLFYQPSRALFLDPERLGLKEQNIDFESKDGTKLHGWFFKAKGDVKGTVIQFHGNAQNITSHYYSLIWLIDHGYNLFTFDYRGYGLSEGRPDQVKIHDDALAALEMAQSLRNQNGGGRFVTYGQSLGGNILLRALPDSLVKNEVGFVVQDSTFASYQDIAFDRIKSVWFLFPMSPLSYLLVSDEMASEKVLDKIHWPTLVIVGQKDEVIPQKFGKEIFKKIPTEKKWLWKIPEGRHIDVFHRDNGIYRKKFLELLDQNYPKG